MAPWPDDDEEEDVESIGVSEQDEEEGDEEDGSVEGNKVQDEDSYTGSQATSSSGSYSDAKFVKKESKYVFWLRILVVVILLCTAIAIAIVTYTVTEGGEQEDYITHYEASAAKVTEHFLEIATEKMAAAATLTVAYEAEAGSRNMSFPFVTLSSFQERAYTLRQISNVLYMGINPIVKDKDRVAWENYSNFGEDAKWYEEGREYQMMLGVDDLDNRPQVKTDDPNLHLTSGVANYIYDFERDTTGKGVISPKADWYLPIWQTSPITRRTMVNQNRASNSGAAVKAIEWDEIAFEGMTRSNPGYGSDDNPVTAEIAWLLRLANGEKTRYEGDIFTTVYFPIHDDFSDDHKPVAVMRIVIHWARFFTGIFPDSTKGLVFVLSNGCDEPYTYQIDGKEVIPMGQGDLHDPKYDSTMAFESFRNVSSIGDGSKDGMTLHQDDCPYMIHVYSSDTFYNQYHTPTPIIITCAIAIVFLFTIFMFFVYDRLVERRQKLLMAKATRTHQIVASLFPKHVRQQILEGDEAFVKGAKKDLSALVNGSPGGETAIADLFPECTVLFADIAGFTAWSSSREPAQVFVLLQNVYQEFDKIAKHRNVFKVETVGDSYVAATGVPEPQRGHAVIMARFAWECLIKMEQITRDLESTLGPDTGELIMRFGIHSGPVTAGVLQGDRARFQLFGDTVNTASRMESTGIKGKIQCSQSTAEALSNAGKEHWVKPREGVVTAKGKGALKTYWVAPHSKAGSTISGASSSSTEMEELEYPQEIHAQGLLRRERQIDWVTELLRANITEIVAKHELLKSNATCVVLPAMNLRNRTPMDEVVESIKLPEFNAKAVSADPHSVKVPDRVMNLLRQYVSIIASAYKDNPFHNFEHACHVTMNVSKFLTRIAKPVDEDKGNKYTGRKLAVHLHDYTHGIHSDPVTKLSLIFAAVIHDVDHRGVSNARLSIEEPNMAARYKGKSIAEQNSFEIAFDLLMADHFDELREYIFVTPDDLFRFRQLVVNLVLATDIFDKDLNTLRRGRWAKAFSESAMVDKERTSFQATVVLEHIMQASDVSHTMQHWHVYRKWNKKLFEELLKAHRDGRMAVDPSTFWYKGELTFFDEYIIPLANKLKNCNVFGVSSDECLNYAVRNRAEWEARGEAIVEEIVEEFGIEHGDNLSGGEGGEE